MATFDLEEQEQISELKLFWQQNGKLILSGISGVLIALAGWQGWNWHVSGRAQEANALYSELTASLEARDAAKIKALAQQLNTAHPGSAQAALGSLILAKSALDANDKETAKQVLRTTMEQSRDPGLRDIATLRLGALLIDEAKFDDAITLASREASAGFVSRFLDLKADALAAAGKNNEARSAWQDALAKIDAAQKGEVGTEKTQAALRDIIVAKLDTLGPAK
ncbi:MAG: hypothetical protein RIR70_406 [Pseudomonadota bacterium]|jgi:predicted negative regulator of RcsB-dependent stress response